MKILQNEQPATIYIEGIKYEFENGVLECKDEGTPSALDAAIVCGIDHTPFDAIAFFLQALQDDAKITAPLRCG